MATPSKTPKSRGTRSKSSRQTGVARPAKSAKARPRKSARSTKPAAAGKARSSTPKRSRRASAHETESYVARFDGWCKQCVEKMRHLLDDRRTKQIGLGLRRGVRSADPRKLLAGTGRKLRHIQFDKVTEFCKKEIKELATLAARLNELAAPPPRRRARKPKLTKEYKES